MDMKVNNANLQIYTNNLQQPARTPAPQAREAQPAEPNQFAAARFADLLSASEKNFILQNFKPESTVKDAAAHLGRHIDVRA